MKNYFMGVLSSALIMLILTHQMIDSSYDKIDTLEFMLLECPEIPRATYRDFNPSNNEET